MEIAGKEYKELQVLADNDELVVSITDENVIEADGYKVVCVSSVPSSMIICRSSQDRRELERVPSLQ